MHSSRMRTSRFALSVPVSTPSDVSPGKGGVPKVNKSPVMSIAERCATGGP